MNLEYVAWGIIYGVMLLVGVLLFTDMVYFTVPAIIAVVWLWRRRRKLMIVRDHR
jgi:hypothetical protein